MRLLSFPLSRGQRSADYQRSVHALTYLQWLYCYRLIRTVTVTCFAKSVADIFSSRVSVKELYHPMLDPAGQKPSKTACTRKKHDTKQ